MTRRPYPVPRHRSPSSTTADHPVVTSVGDLIAAVPALLGFVPARSIVLICLSTGSPTVVEMCMRQDLSDRLDSPELADVIERCGEVCTREGLDAVVAVLITGSKFTMPYEVVADALRDTLDPRGIDLFGVHHVSHLAVGQRWRSLGGDPRCGTLPDPGSSQVAASRVMAGRQIRTSRSEIALLLQPVPESECERFRNSRLRVELEDGPVGHSDLLADTVVFLEALRASDELDHLTAARIMVAISTIAVRDAVLGLATTALGPTAEAVWVELTRRVSGPDRAHPATMLGAWAYLRGDGPLAGVALQTALTADPEYRFAQLLDTALQNGVRPTVVRELVLSARSLAEDLGVELPPDAV
ncbi:DUF4192 domain-containing protein [Rhodococcus sp. UNC23MFCrub1.1]|uniref:DUF4192 domain-containing protein n=1 Tax=Rhodococcus sp. UNC23MFCrub1.1 TaxID=1449068 RepID=UPI0009DD5597|nr:DUF4192 domain-containing protein [Rhodococcus sp. UNC23MFCrub1.1]